MYTYYWQDFDLVFRTIWSRALPIKGYDPNHWRQDKNGQPMKHDQYANRNSYFGWFVNDQERPESFTI